MPSHHRSLWFWDSVIFFALLCILFLGLDFRDTSILTTFENGTHSSTIPSLMQDSSIAIEAPLGDDPATPSASIVSIPYGPITIPARTMGHQKLLAEVRKPCESCYITAMRATLATQNDTEIFTDSGIWLQHITFFNHGRKDLVCPDMAGERFFGGGNERNTWRWNTRGLWGYQVKDHHRWDIMMDVMNISDEEADLNIVVRYEIVPAEKAEGYRNVAAIWLDMSGCGDAEMGIKSFNDPFEYRSHTWLSSTSGIIVSARGHMRDGGVSMTIYRNDVAICASDQVYDNQAAVQHIIGGGVCRDIGRVNKGDALWVDAKYDPNLHNLISYEDVPDTIMGAMGIYIGLDWS